MNKRRKKGPSFFLSGGHQGDKADETDESDTSNGDADDGTSGETVVGFVIRAVQENCLLKVIVPLRGELDVAVRGVIREKLVNRPVEAGELFFDDSVLVDRVDHGLADLDVVGGKLVRVQDDDAVLQQEDRVEWKEDRFCIRNYKS